jgi:hypothetical protein
MKNGNQQVPFLLLALVSACATTESTSRDSLKHSYGSHPFAVYAFGDWVKASDATLLSGARPFQRYSGGLGFGAGTQFAMTSFGTLTGAEGEVELGGGTGNIHSDGKIRFNELKPDPENPATFSITFRAAARAKISPIWFRFSDEAGLRIGFMGGASFDGITSRIWNTSFVSQLGVNLVLRIGGFQLNTNVLYSPPQGEEWKLARIQANANLVFGAFVLGGRWTLENAVASTATPTYQKGLVAEQTFSATVGFAFGE